MFFDDHQYKLSEEISNIKINGYKSRITSKSNVKEIIKFNYNNIVLSGFFTTTISILTLIISLFIYQSVNLLNAGLIFGHVVLKI